MTDKFQLYIDGSWRKGSQNEEGEIIDPATEEVIGRVCLASMGDLQDALAAAERGFRLWRSLPVAKRSQLLQSVARLIRERVALLSRGLTLEQGKTLKQATAEVLTTAAYFDDLASSALHVFGRLLMPDEAGMTRSVVYEPVGPVFAVAPWNLPALMPGRKIANALAAGCTIILKPAKETPATALRIAQCCHDAGIPPGVVNVVCGDSSAISQLCIGSSIVRKVSFTGSTAVGKELAQLAGAHMKRVTMELGGHAPLIVCEDADVMRVVDLVVPVRHSNAGQSCLAPTRVFVHEHLYSRFARSFAERAAALRVGSGLEADAEMGPLASLRRIPVMENMVTDALQKGAKLSAGGRRLDRSGYFFPATVLEDVPAGAAIMVDEPFGPVTAIIPFADDEKVVNLANDSPYGLAAYVFSRDVERARSIASQLETGLVGINSLAVAHPTVPFGGVKDSGIGREGSFEGLLESMVSKAITLPTKA